MPELLSFPSVWQKPALGSLLDTSHPFTQNMALCAIFNEGSGNVFWDPATRALGSLFSGSPSWAAGKSGTAFNFGAGTAEIRFPVSEPFAGGNIAEEFTVMALVNPSTVAVRQAAWSYGNQLGVGSAMEFGLSAAAQVEMVDVAGAIVSLGPAIAANTWTVICSSQHSGLTGGTGSGFQYHATYDFHKFTSLTKTTTESTTRKPNPFDPYSIGASYSAGAAANFWNGLIEFVFVWSQGMPLDQIESLMTDPYQIFVAPSPSRFFLPLVAASPAFTWQPLTEYPDIVQNQPVDAVPY